MLDVLAGIRVLEVAEHGFVPSAGTALADWGAEVIKVEHPGRGDPMRHLLSWGIIPGTDPAKPSFMTESLFRSKRCVAIDVAKPEGRALLFRLVATADVFLTNLLPSSRQRLGIDVEEVRAVNPRIIYARGHGQGAKGPEADAGGFDAVSFWARGSVQERLTPPGQALIGQRPATGDFTSGLTLAGAIAAALVKRERTGHAAVVDVSLLGVAAWMMSPDVNAAMQYGRDLPKLGNAKPISSVARTYVTRDDKYVTLMMWQDEPRFFPIFVRAAGWEDLLADARFATPEDRVENAAPLIAEVERRFAERSREDWVERLKGTECIWGLNQSPIDIPDDPQVRANGYILEIDRGDDEPFRAVAAPTIFDGEAPGARHAAQELGEETETVLREAGVSDDELGRAAASGAIARPSAGAPR
ncbi:MAG: CoA transferase [Deltaproteobacteria bacterium]|nr:CoA transferase [Deltaproteobacteria bacterium]